MTRRMNRRVRSGEPGNLETALRSPPAESHETEEAGAKSEQARQFGQELGLAEHSAVVDRRLGRSRAAEGDEGENSQGQGEEDSRFQVHFSRGN